MAYKNYNNPGGVCYLAGGQHTQSEAFDSVSSRGHLDFYHHHLDLMATAMACFSDFLKRWGEGVVIFDGETFVADDPM